MTTKMMTGDASSLAERLVTRKGFMECWWEIVKELSAAKEDFTYKGVFEYLNGIRKEKYGEYAFSTYSAFHMWLKRRN